MDFFRSILAEDDPDPESISNNQQSDTDPQEDDYEDDSNSNSNSNSNINSSEEGSTTGGLWSFGDIVKTLTTKSESVFETYRRDLKEFGSGLRKESDLFREVASRAVKELPDVGSSVIKTTSEIISQGKEALLISSDDESDRYRYKYRDRYNNNSSSDNNDKNMNNRYSRFDVQLSVIRSDERTYLDEPEDIEEYTKWKLGFVVGEMRDEIERLVSDKAGVGGVYERVVPDKVDDGTFWFRYFYKVYKLRMQEDMRARLVKRSLSVDDEEELSWDVDDDDEEKGQSKLNTSKGEDLQSVGKTESRDDELKSESLKNVGEGNEANGNIEGLNPSGSAEKGKPVTEVDEKVDNKVEDSKAVVKSDRALVQEDEDLEWDEIEDLGDNDDTKVTHDGTTDKVELRKRLSNAADDDEDLSWDIEDDDDNEPEKAGTK